MSQTLWTETQISRGLLEDTRGVVTANIGRTLIDSFLAEGSNVAWRAETLVVFIHGLAGGSITAWVGEAGVVRKEVHSICIRIWSTREKNTFRDISNF